MARKKNFLRRCVSTLRRKFCTTSTAVFCCTCCGNWRGKRRHFVTAATKKARSDPGFFASLWWPRRCIVRESASIFRMTPQPTSRVDPQTSLAESNGHRWHLRRITSGGSWIPEIDGLRFVAISSVVLYHIYAQLLVRSGHPVAVQARYTWLGYGVWQWRPGSSAFLCHQRIHSRNGICAAAFASWHASQLKKYFLRRVTRLEPPYILNLVFCALVAFFYYHQALGYMIPHLLASVVYQHNLAIERQASSTGLRGAWKSRFSSIFWRP